MITPDTLARFKKENKSIMNHITYKDGEMYVDTEHLEQLGIHYIYEEPETEETIIEVKPKETIRFICDNNLQLTDTFNLIKKLIYSVKAKGYFIPTINTYDGYAQITTLDTVLQFCLKNYRHNDYYPADHIISQVPDPYYSYFQMRDGIVPGQTEITRQKEKGEY